MKFNLWQNFMIEYTVLSTESLVVGAGHSWLSVISSVESVESRSLKSAFHPIQYPVSTFHRLRDQL